MKKIHLGSAKYENKVYENKKNNNASIVGIFLQTKMVIALDPLLSTHPLLAVLATLTNLYRRPFLRLN